MGSAASTAHTVARNSLDTNNQTNRMTDITRQTENRTPSSENMNENNLNKHEEEKQEEEEQEEQEQEENEEQEEQGEEETRKIPFAFKIYRDEKVDALRKSIAITKSLSTIFHENGEIREQALQLIELIYENYKIPMNSQPKDIKRHRIVIADICVDEKLTHTIFDILNHVHNQWKYGSSEFMDQATFSNFYKCMFCLSNYTDASERLCYAVCIESGFLELMKTLLSEIRALHLQAPEKIVLMFTVMLAEAWHECVFDFECSGARDLCIQHKCQPPLNG